MDAIIALTTRISPAKLAEPGPTPSQLEQMIAAAAAAPDHGRMRPWRFILIEGSARERFGEMLARALQRREPTAPQAKIAAERQKAMRAPTILVLAAAVQGNPKVPEIEQVVAVGAAAQNILIAAHALGLGGFWRTGPAAYDPEVKEALGFGRGDTIIGFLYLGSVAVPGRPREIEPAPIIRSLA
ncbi:MAG: nitroreductase [Alphaproteobacteria bacterium]|nr:nitroreductase [Alphaproteobacteria bacterium]